MSRIHDAAQQMNDSQPSVVSEAFCFSLIRIAQALHPLAPRASCERERRSWRSSLRPGANGIRWCPTPPSPRSRCAPLPATRAIPPIRTIHPAATFSPLGPTARLDRDRDADASRTFDSTPQAIDWEVHPISPVTKDWIAVKSPTILLTSLMFYFAVVGGGFAVLRNKPKEVGAKDPFWIRSLVIFHNVFLVVLSLYMCGGCLLEAYRNGYNVWGNAYNPKETALAHYIWVFYVSKMYEFLDTFIMLLKNNLKQVSFLHVYHHATISFMWWMIAHRAPGGDAYFSAALNSWVHVCMYTYYLMAVLIGKDEKKRKKYLWWGRYLTQMQMFQFFLNLCQSVYTSLYSPYPKFISHILFFYMISLLGLFGHFYYTKHVSPAAKKAKAKKLK